MQPPGNGSVSHVVLLMPFPQTLHNDSGPSITDKRQAALDALFLSRPALGSLPLSPGSDGRMQLLGLLMVCLADDLCIHPSIRISGDGNTSAPWPLRPADVLHRWRSCPLPGRSDDQDG